MDQELLLNVCSTIINSGKENALDGLKKTIEDNKGAITDKTLFYSELISILASKTLTITVKSDNGKLEKTNERLSELNYDKLDYLEELIFDNLDIGASIKKPLALLCQYDDAKVIKLIIKLSETPEFKEYVVDGLSNIGLYYYNEKLVDLVLEKGLYNNTILNGLISAIKDVNFEAQVESENAKYSDPLELSQAQRKIEQIKQKHKMVAAAIIKVFNHLGKRVQPKNAFFHDIICQNEELNEDFYNLFANIDKYDTSALDFIDIANCLSWGNSESIVHLLILMNKLPRENFGDLKAVNKIVNNAFLERIKDGVGLGFDDDENQFLEDVLESQAIYNLSATNLVKIVEYLYGDMKHIPSERVKEVRTEYAKNYNSDNDGNLATEMFNVVEPITEAGHNGEHFLEELLIELLESRYAEHYEKSILNVLDGRNVIDMKFKATLIRPYSELPYVICTCGSDEMIRLALKEHGLPMYMFNDGDSTDLFKIYTRLGEYDKALEVLNDPLYELVDEGEKACLEEYGQYDMENAEYYVDNLSVIIQTLRFRKDIAGINFLKEVIQNPKLTIINAESFERLNLLFTELSENDPEIWQTFNQISSYIKERIQHNDLMTYVAVEEFDGISGYGGLRMATDEEIGNAVSMLGTEKPVIKKLVPTKKDALN